MTIFKIVDGQGQVLEVCETDNQEKGQVVFTVFVEREEEIAQSVYLNTDDIAKLCKHLMTSNFSLHQ